ncbi:hypothetical protein [Sphaerotilus sp.]|uniref:hypothetical protein n=1 Tax=Sphaerotilus sp. TaxID=2093942 RepID=UPI00286E8C5E|nr:hypothetical protein [Sphaerotilus sp.]
MSTLIPLTLYGVFETTVIAAACGWALWHTATRVLKLKLGRHAVAASSGGCGSGCGGCSASPGAASACGSPAQTISVSVVAAPSTRRRSG